jgi:hypothetical protein
MATLSDGEKRKQRARNGQRRAMEGRKCPECKRGNALSKFVSPDGGWMGKRCRYCTYERGGFTD